MNRPQSYRPFLLGALGACLVLGFGLSRDVRGAAAALVQVTNTALNPVITKAADNPARSAFATRVFPTVRSASSFVVPAGKYLVINSVTGFNNGTTAYAIAVDTSSGGTYGEQQIPFAIATRPGSWTYLQGVPVNIVADPGTTVYISVGDSDFNDSAGVNVDVRGYYVDAS
ncbi:hypothetical protein [Roseateles saccharophilus]|uniref:Uncharacterized protein n=1 Tax=Roseateles saccharophilus TaxID=304 RepID=A0A4R3UL33_ROSSA|nr:hypothetical protein [Roseateles saccharophilus]MDG0834131.1 hypothetical protein [Roseateles saccharophilus]TCU91347.1 hypothetical protein EV671_102665 [Roseateles saccharophilus]